ncbi:Glycine betaine/L-proline transport system permease protein ProW [Pseudovibrio axinellae]|uniref:Glycine betaine/L-proline transport system permease protein ProW n=1 Tax=Pseudovibrio axinellae TaxID=989403 RepID=A0A166AJY3_9HYPH|nr:ABC transporter permease subunit [Pseudovibrio axinellae]KZL21215.1 Glycine betaine/L-proline transport system permease protein ProW [Pseudovibrio axinellae]SEQ92281.1 glycine betaine/proline transport system permease protein [Pseudovibrio axinellae]
MSIHFPNGLRKPVYFWLFLFTCTWLLSNYSFTLYKALGARWIIKFPSAWEWQLDVWISSFMTWLVEDAGFGLFTFRQLTRFLSALIEAPYNAMRALLADGFNSGLGQHAVEIFPAMSWVAITLLLVLLALCVGGRSLALLVGGCFLYLATFGQWQSAMVTLASIAIAVPIGVIGGLVLGILAYRSERFERLQRPVLDLMQTVPIFAYLVPILFLFGFGPVSALVATIIYAMPPMVRVVLVALQSVPEPLHEAGRMAGCTPRQMMWRVLLPSALPTLMVGVNQVIMLSLNMVIIASIIGAGGLGYDVLAALRRLDIGGGIEAGMAIVVIAIALDRLSQAFTKSDSSPNQSFGFVRSKPLLYFVIALMVTITMALLGKVWPVVQNYPEPMVLTTGRFWDEVIKWININFFEVFETVKTALLTYFLLPVKRFFVGIPWAWGIIALGLAGWRVSGAKLGLLCAALAGAIAANGLWREAMIAVYLCGVSVLLATAVGIPLGVWAGQSESANKILSTLVDTLQTLPSFVYLIPVVMLFRVGEFTAMVAIVIYAMAPALRYAAHGIREINPQVIEAGKVSGCTHWQLLWRIKLPLAVPSLLLGLNQTIMLALSMLVITALVGTRDLGQEVYIALTKANTGQGIVAGLAVAFIAIIADRILSALAKSSQARLGLVT